MVRALMCPQCRRNRQKCEPAQRTWSPAGVQEKCARCIRYGHQCGPPEYPPSQVHTRAVRNAQHNRRVSGEARVVGQDLEAAPIAGPVVSAAAVVPMDNNIELRLELRRRLADLDNHVEAIKQLQYTIDVVLKDELENDNLRALQSSMNATLRDLTLMLGPTESLADRLELAGQIGAAESAYVRVLEAYRVFPIKAWYEVKKILRKMADMFWKIHEPVRAESFIWQALDLREVPPLAQDCDLDLLKILAQSLVETSMDLSSVVQSKVDGVVPAHLHTPFPPLQRMMQSTYASVVQCSVFQQGAFPDPNNPIVGGMHAILELLRLFPDADLERRDVLGRSPLHLAGNLRMEGLGRGLIIRAREGLDIPLERLTNARDFSGQPVLGTSIYGGCCLSFIEDLIDNGAEVDPEPLKESHFTPLQAAACCGNSELVDLLLDRGANPNRVFLGYQTAGMIAHDRGHLDIARRLGYLSPEV